MNKESSPNPCLADFIRPETFSQKDYLGAFCVTAGLELPQLVRHFEKDHDDEQLS